MNKPSLQIFKTERMQVALILFAVILSAFLTYRLVVVPQREMAENNLHIHQKLTQSRYATLSSENMLTIQSQEASNLTTLSNEWSHIVARLATFPHQLGLSGTEVNRIDYKVELYEIRERLRAKSEELKIQLLPTELGLDESVASSDVIRVRMLQLKAVEKLADLALDRQIQSLVEIYPLEPVKHRDASGHLIFDEYPVRIECDVEFENLFTFFQSVFEENQVFVFRNLRIESGPTFAAKLRVKAVLSALLFD